MELRGWERRDKKSSWELRDETRGGEGEEKKRSRWFPLNGNRVIEVSTALGRLEEEHPEWVGRLASVRSTCSSATQWGVKNSFGAPQELPFICSSFNRQQNNRQLCLRKLITFHSLPRSVEEPFPSSSGVPLLLLLLLWCSGNWLVMLFIYWKRGGGKEGEEMPNKNPLFSESHPNTIHPLCLRNSLLPLGTSGGGHYEPEWHREWGSFE